MSATIKLQVLRQKVGPVQRTPRELAEIRAVREKFQRDKPTLDQVLASTGQDEATTLGEYLQARELLLALGQVRQRQKMTLAQLAARTGYDPAVLSRLLTGRQTNPTLATVGRIARALGKAVVHALCDLPAASQRTGPTKRKKAAAPDKA
jgi:DNA-binding phage protein